MNEPKNPYEDIIHLPHPVSMTRPQMPVADRAAQFSPFAALTGYETAIKETARLTQQRIELDETQKHVINEKLQMIQESILSSREYKENEALHQVIEITYFRPDDKKEGGSYETLHKCVKKIDPVQQSIVFDDGTSIVIDDILEVSGDQFKENLIE